MTEDEKPKRTAKATAARKWAADKRMARVLADRGWTLKTPGGDDWATLMKREEAGIIDP
jgi:hypothetical protein